MVSLMRRSQYQAYSAARQTASKTRQVVMLYDGVIRFVQQAKQAIEEKRYEDRYHLLTKASEVVIGLQGSLDFQQGGAIAQQLYDFYSTIQTQLMSIHRTNSLEDCDEVVEAMKVMRHEWHRIDTLREQESTALASQQVALDSVEDDSEIQQEEASDSASSDPASGVQLSV